MRESTKAYVAGLMDAEGCFSIYRTTPRADGSTRTQYQPRIVLSNVDLPVIKWLVASFGGFYTKHTPAKGKVWYQWNLNGKTSASTFLSLLMPYLRLKKQEALILQEFFGLGEGINPAKRQELMDKIRAAKIRECVTTDTLDGQDDDKRTHAYIAGIMDGEGCISASFAPTGKPMLRIRMGNGYFPLIQMFQRLYGGWFHTQHPKGNTREFYTWELTDKKSRESFLLQVLPYLRIKRNQAKLALEFTRIPKTAERIERAKICNEIREINRPKIQPELMGDHKSAPAEMQIA